MATEKMQLTPMHNGAVERPIDIRKIWAIAKKNWMVLKGDKIRLFPLFLFPILMIVVFGFASGNTPKHIPAGIVDYDNSEFSIMVRDELASMELFSIKSVSGTQDEGRKLLDEGKIKVLFILPEKLGEKVASASDAQIQVMVDESDSSVAQIAKSSAQVFASRLSSEATDMRLRAISEKSMKVQNDIAGANSANAPSSMPSPSSSAGVLMRDLALTYSKSANLVQSTIRETKNSLGYLVDQNEAVESFSPASAGRATISLLAVGDQQQSALQQIAVYSALGGAQAQMFKDAQGIYADAKKAQAQSDAQAKSSAITAQFLSVAKTDAASVSSGISAAHTPITLEVLEPYGYGRRGIDFLLASILALTIFQGATMGLGRAIAGERKDGSLTRVFLTPTSNITIILGTQIFYMLLETVRSTMLILVAIALFSVSISGSMLDIIIIVAIFAMGATGVGMVLSVLAKNQEQYMALAMLVSMPIMFLSGVFFPIQTMPPALQTVAQALPVNYAADALRGIMVKGFTLSQLMPDIAALLAFNALTLVLSLLLFKRELV